MKFDPNSIAVGQSGSRSHQMSQSRNTLPALGLATGPTPNRIPTVPPSISRLSPSSEPFGTSQPPTTEFSILSYLADLQVHVIIEISLMLVSHVIITKSSFVIILQCRLLQDSSEAVRQRGLHNIYIYVEVFARGVSNESFTQVMETLCDRLYASLGSENPYAIFGIVVTIDALVSVRGVSDLFEDTCKNCCIRFISFLRILFQTKSVFQLPTRDSGSQSTVTEEDVWNLIIISKTATALAHVAREGNDDRELYAGREL